MTAIALTIAGSDSGGGAGIQADLKTFSAMGVFGTSALAALTAQNTQGVSAIHEVPADFVVAQIDAVLSDMKVGAIKIGMLASVEIIEAVAECLKRHLDIPVVLDPVMVAESGDPLIHDEAVAALKDALFPLSTLVTPNLHEAARLLGASTAIDRDQMEKQATDLLAYGARAVLVKGGHSVGQDAADVYVEANSSPVWLEAEFIETRNTHGTGCSLSSAIASGLAGGQSLSEAVSSAKVWLTRAIARADELQIGKGAGPVHHFHEFWSN